MQSLTAWRVGLNHVLMLHFSSNNILTAVAGSIEGNSALLCQALIEDREAGCSHKWRTFVPASQACLEDNLHLSKLQAAQVSQAIGKTFPI